MRSLNILNLLKVNWNTCDETVRRCFLNKSKARSSGDWRRGLIKGRGEMETSTTLLQRNLASNINHYFLKLYNRQRSKEAEIEMEIFNTPKWSSKRQHSKRSEILRSPSAKDHFVTVSSFECCLTDSLSLSVTQLDAIQLFKCRLIGAANSNCLSTERIAYSASICRRPIDNNIII